MKKSVKRRRRASVPPPPSRTRCAGGCDRLPLYVIRPDHAAIIGTERLYFCDHCIREVDAAEREARWNEELVRVLGPVVARIREAHEKLDGPRIISPHLRELMGG